MSCMYLSFAHLLKIRNSALILTEFIQCVFTLQNVCRLPFTWHSLYVDRLYHMFWRLCKYGRWMRFLRRCWWSGVTITIYHGFNRAWTVHCNWHILQCTCGNNGWATDLAAALSYTCKTNANESESCLLQSISVSLLSWFMMPFSIMCWRRKSSLQMFNKRATSWIR